MDFVDQGGEKIDISIRFDLHHVAGSWRGGLYFAGIDMGDGTAAGDDLPERGHGVGHVHEADMGYLGVRANAQKIVGVLEIRYRVQIGSAEHGFGGGELVGAILGARSEGVLYPYRPREAPCTIPAGAVERRRIANVHTHGVTAILIRQGLDALGDLLYCGIPTQILKFTYRGLFGVGTCPGMIDAVWIAMQFHIIQTFVAGETLVHRMRLVRLQADNLLVLDGSDHRALGFADTAICGYAFHRLVRVMSMANEQASIDR